VGLELARSPGVYDAKNDTIFYSNELQFSKPEARVEMVKLITEALIAQNMTFTQAPPLTLNDSVLATAALHRGDIARTAKVYDQNTRLLSGNTATAPLTPPAGYPAPSVAVQRLFDAPRALGLAFMEKVFPATAFEKINEAYSKPPLTMAEVMHPEFYVKSKPWAAQPVTWPNDLLDGAKPLHNASLGEAGLAIWTKGEVAGWTGDRFAVWDGGAEGDAWVMETRWSDEAAAAKFFAAAKAVAGGSATDEDASEGVFATHLKAQARPYRVYQDKTRVIVLSAGADAKADVLKTQFVKP
jgi:hypothetical protein